MFKIIILFLGVYFTNCNLLYAWSEGTTHPEITEYAINSKPHLVEYLKNNLGFPEGLRRTFNFKIETVSQPTILQLFRFGAKAEDDEERGLNHFHNPLKPTSEAGLNDVFTIFKGKSNFAWANGDISNNDYSWKNARESFRDALSATDPSTRDENFAKTFRSVGQVMHLIEDMAVPAYTS